MNFIFSHMTIPLQIRGITADDRINSIWNRFYTTSCKTFMHIWRGISNFICIISPIFET